MHAFCASLLRDGQPVRGLLWRPWLLGAGVFFGLACGTKWNAAAAKNNRIIMILKPAKEADFSMWHWVELSKTAF